MEGKIIEVKFNKAEGIYGWGNGIYVPCQLYVLTEIENKIVGIDIKPLFRLLFKRLTSKIIKKISDNKPSKVMIKINAQGIHFLSKEDQIEWTKKVSPSGGVCCDDGEFSDMSDIYNPQGTVTKRRQSLKLLSDACCLAKSQGLLDQLIKREI